MTFSVITHVKHINKDDFFFAYSPYVLEMNIWIKYAKECVIVAPLVKLEISPIETNYIHKNIKFFKINNFNAIGVASKIDAFLKIPKNLITIFKAMQKADHIHIRCPGNIGLLGCLVQIFFPNKPKTAKYAGNWDPKSKQPLSYKVQKWILSNTFLTKNMQVLVYGEWPNQTRNIKSFFTATYYEKDKKPVITRNLDGKIKLLFAGTLARGKRPSYAVQLVEKLFKAGHDVQLELFGEGAERETLQDYISDNGLENIIFLMGNQTKERLREAYESSHFLVLPSQSEGWPKVVAEAMFWGCVPVSSKVSCVPNMLHDGERGLLLEMDIEKDVQNMADLIKQPDDYHKKAEKAVFWSRKYTLDYFENEIKLLLKKS